MWGMEQSAAIGVQESSAARGPRRLRFMGTVCLPACYEHWRRGLCSAALCVSAGSAFQSELSCSFLNAEFTKTQRAAEPNQVGQAPTDELMAAWSHPSDFVRQSLTYSRSVSFVLQIRKTGESGEP